MDLALAPSTHARGVRIATRLRACYAAHQIETTSRSEVGSAAGRTIIAVLLLIAGLLVGGRC